MEDYRSYLRSMDYAVLKEIGDILINTQLNTLDNLLTAKENYATALLRAKGIDPTDHQSAFLNQFQLVRTRTSTRTGHRSINELDVAKNSFANAIWELLNGDLESATRKKVLHSIKKNISGKRRCEEAEARGEGPRRNLPRAAKRRRIYTEIDAELD